MVPSSLSIARVAFSSGLGEGGLGFGLRCGDGSGGCVGFSGGGVVRTIRPGLDWADPVRDVEMVASTGGAWGRRTAGGKHATATSRALDLKNVIVRQISGITCPYLPFTCGRVKIASPVVRLGLEKDGQGCVEDKAYHGRDFQ